MVFRVMKRDKGYSVIFFPGCMSPEGLELTSTQLPIG